MFGLRVRALVTLVMLNGLAALLYLGCVFWTVQYFEHAGLIEEFLAYATQAGWRFWLIAAGFLVALGNAVPLLWLLAGFRRSPGRVASRQVAFVTAGALLVSCAVFTALFFAYPDAVFAPDLVNNLVNILSWGGLPLLQVAGALFVECFDRAIRFRRRVRGACVACGYSMRNIPRATCPECGTCGE